MTLQRFSHVVYLRPEKREEYMTLHARVWPEIELLLSEARITNYSIFAVRDLLISYYEYVGSNVESDLKALSEHPTMREWVALTEPCQVPLDERFAMGWEAAHEIWHLA